MTKEFFLLLTFSILPFIGFSQNEVKIEGPQSQIIADMISAVNQKDAKSYVVGFSDSVQVFVESALKVDGKKALLKNRAAHFERHPNVRSEIQHLVEIDDKVILHDKVWLDGANNPQDIVEIFSFKDNEVVRVDVIQPKNLFKTSQ